MASSMGVLRWSPDTFWSATFYEFTAAMKGYLAAKGVKGDDSAMDRNDFLDMKDEARRNGKEV
jgi:hypothetical protein